MKVRTKQYYVVFLAVLTTSIAPNPLLHLCAVAYSDIQSSDPVVGFDAISSGSNSVLESSESPLPHEAPFQTEQPASPSWGSPLLIPSFLAEEPHRGTELFGSKNDSHGINEDDNYTSKESLMDLNVFSDIELMEDTPQLQPEVSRFDLRDQNVSQEYHSKINGE